MFFEKPSALPEVKCYNPAFDVTDHSLITGIITEKGICYPPFEDSFAKVFGKGRAYDPLPHRRPSQGGHSGRRAEDLPAGLVAANDGNLSVRVGENALWVTPTGVCKGT